MALFVLFCVMLQLSAEYYVNAYIKITIYTGAV
jgi:hypothetical protein